MNVCDVHVCIVWFMPTVRWNPQAPVHPNLWPPHQSDFHNHTHRCQRKSYLCPIFLPLPGKRKFGLFPKSLCQLKKKQKTGEGELPGNVTCRWNTKKERDQNQNQNQPRPPDPPYKEWLPEWSSAGRISGKVPSYPS